MAKGYALFETALGCCAAAWSDRGLVAVQLAEPSREATVARIRAQLGPVDETPPPAWARDAMQRIAHHIEGRLDDLADVPLDLERVPPFRRRVYEAARGVLPGETITYGDLAARVGSPGGARAVGQAMAKNPLPIVVPCHRVLAAGGGIGGFSAPGGASTKRRLLAIESPNGDEPPRLPMEALPPRGMP